MGPSIRTFLGISLVSLAGAIAVTAGAPAGAAGTPTDRWSAEDLALLASLQLGSLPAAAPDPSNAVESLPAAAALGKRLFHDTRLSANQAVSCASCHAPEQQFQDGQPVGRGVGTGTRRSMPIVGAGRGPWLFWDGRKDSLWSQALGPLEDGVEHGSNRARIAGLVQAHYGRDYEAVFGALPAALPARPVDAGPLGAAAEQAAWLALAPATREAVNRVFANTGKAIAAYEKTLAHGASRFDRYAQAALAGTARSGELLSAQEVQGLRLFIGKGQCATCHNGPLLSDQQFHNTGVPPRDAQRPDPGRAVAIARLQHDEFNCLGPYSDAQAGPCEELRFMVTDGAALQGAFKTPSLRNVALRPPYMHAGQFGSLEQVIDHYMQAPAAVLGHTELAHGAPGHTQRQPIRLSSDERAALVAFLASLSGPTVEVQAARR